MQSTAGGEKEEEDEGYGVAHSVHHGPSQGAKTQLPQDLKSGQKTVVGGLKVEEVKTEKDRERALLSDIINGTHSRRRQKHFAPNKHLHATFGHFHLLNSFFHILPNKCFHFHSPEIDRMGWESKAKLVPSHGPATKVK